MEPTPNAEAVAVDADEWTLADEELDRTDAGRATSATATGCPPCQPGYCEQGWCLSGRTRAD